MPSRLISLFIAIAVAVASPALAQQSPHENSKAEVRIGQTMAYSGPAASYSTVGKLDSAYFAMLNEKGGINGHPVKFISLDDAYQPNRTLEQTRRLVEQEKVSLLFQSLGTATNKQVRAYLNQAGVPQLFVATGSSIWNDPKNFPWTMGFNLSYDTEGRIYARWLLANRPDAKVAILYQNDDFGRDLLNGFRTVLGDSAPRMIVGEESYETTDTTPDSQLLKLQATGADTLLDISTAKVTAQTIRKIYESGWKPLHFISNVSSSVDTVMMPAGPEKSIGARTVTYYKDPNDPAWDNDQGMQQFRAFMKKYYPDGNVRDQLNVYAYIASQLLTSVLQECGDDLSRENIMRHAKSISSFHSDLLLPGIEIRTTPDNYAPIRQGEMERFEGNQWKPYGEVIRQ